jgi:magnesium transporter
MTTITWYEQGEFRTYTVDELCAIAPASIPKGATVWVDMSNPTPEDEQQLLTTWLGVHELVLDDMRRNDDLAEGMHPAKVEEFEEYLFLIFHAVPIPERKPDEDVGTFIHRIRGQQLNFIMTEQLILTHHEVALACIGDVQRMVLKNRLAMERGPDYITALILDEIVDSMNAYNTLVEDRVEELERLVMKGESTYTIRRLLDHKNRNQFTRRKLMQHREIVARLSRGEFKVIGMDEAVYYRNVHDHLVHAVDHVDTIRESILSLIDLYFSMSSTRLNQVMRVLTVISTVFLPITFVTSWYGMNFHHMPELEWMFGYPMVLAIIIIISVAMYVVFRKRGWLA